MVVFENRFPSFALDTPAPNPLSGGEPFARQAGVGQCEVVSLPPTTTPPSPPSTPERVRTVGRRLGRPHGRPQPAGRHRTGLLLREPRRGDRRHLAHPHGQIYAYPYLTPAPTDAAMARDHTEAAGHQPLRRPARRRARGRGPHRGRLAHWTAFVPRRPGGRSRSTSIRPPGARHRVAVRCRAGRLRAASTSMCWLVWTRSSTLPPLRGRRGTRLRSAPAATWRT